MKERLQKVLDELRYLKKVKNQSDFAEQLGYGRSYFSQIMNGSEPLNYKIASKVETLFGISKSWLMDGEGEMFISNIEIKEGQPKEVIALGKHVPLRLKPEEYSKAFGDWKGLPIYNSPISASFISQYHDEKIMNPMYYLHDPRFKDCQFGAVITGDSMHSEIRHGDIAMCREIVDKSFIVFGDIYYVVAENGLETCKYINAGSDENTLMLVPRNELISPSPIKKDMVKNLYKVRGIIRGY